MAALDYPEETANHSVNEVLYLHDKNWEPKGELSAASLADTKGFMLFSACHDQ